MAPGMRADIYIRMDFKRAEKRHVMAKFNTRNRLPSRSQWSLCAFGVLMPGFNLSGVHCGEWLNLGVRLVK